VPPFRGYNGTFIMTAPNGKDSLTGTYVGKNTNARYPYGFGPFAGELRITGGAGKFDDARRQAHFTAVADINCSRAFYAVEGTLQPSQPSACHNFLPFCAGCGVGGQQPDDPGRGRLTTISVAGGAV